MRLRHYIAICSWFALIAIAISLFACQSKSALTNALCQPEDFPGKWRWTIGDINQNPDSSLVGNNFSLESSARAFIGIRKDGNSAVTVWHRIEKYTQPVMEFGIQQYDEFDKEGQIWTPTLPRLGHSMFSSCSKSNGTQDPVYYCRVIVKYTHIIYNLTFIETGLNDSEVEWMLETVLLQIDQRVRGISQ